MPQHRTRINESGFKIGIGIFLAIALAAACGRIAIRVRQNRGLRIDDTFFFVAVAALIAGTALTYVAIPDIYLEQRIVSDDQHARPDSQQDLVKVFSFLEIVLAVFCTSLFGVKMSFLFFFRNLLHRLPILMKWWWTVLAITVVSCFFMILSPILICTSQQESFLAKCLSSTALFETAISLDLLGDILVVSIPVALLWRSQIALRRKLVLGAILCLSVFTAIVCIIRAVGSDISSGQVDLPWLNLWLQIEAAIAVVIVSVTAYRSLFVGTTSYDRGNRPSRGTPSHKWIHRRSKLELSRLPKIPLRAFTAFRPVTRDPDRTNRHGKSTTPSNGDQYSYLPHDLPLLPRHQDSPQEAGEG